MRAAIAYVRVSTEQQGATGIGLDAQKAQIQQYAKDSGYRIKKTFVEVASAMEKKGSKRPVLLEAIDASRARRCPILVASLDRVSRDTVGIENLMKKHRFKILVASLDAQANRVIIRSEVARAQFEGEQIGRRTKEALQQRKAAGVRLGNPTNLKDAQAKGAASNRELAKLRQDDFAKALSEARARGALTAKEIADALNKMDFPTARGGAWTQENVYRKMGNQNANSRNGRGKFSESAPSLQPFAGSERILTPEGVERVRKAMEASKYKPGTSGKLMNDMGFNPYDTSVIPGLSGLAPLKEEHLSALTEWVTERERKAER
jgi:DNA invertase Pin-like site-specific DNA recombinase